MSVDAISSMTDFMKKSAMTMSGSILFLLNLIFNFLFTTIQFKLRNFALAAVDVLAVWATLVWALVAIWPVAPWVAYLNLPYLAWVTFASVLQITIVLINRGSSQRI